MDVMVYWSRDGIGKGAIDHYSSPYSGGWSLNRVMFGNEGGKWGVRVRTAPIKKGVEAKDDGEYFYLSDLSQPASGLDEYEAWLEENVDAIQVNGYPWWQSERVSEAARIADGLDALIGQEDEGS